jgi:hypothetical protein
MKDSKVISMKNQKFSNIYDLLNSNKKKQGLGVFGEFVYRSYCRQKKFECAITNYLRADVVIFHSEQRFVDVKTSTSNAGPYKGDKPQKKYNYAYDQVFVNKDLIKIFPDENSLLKEFVNNNNEIVIENSNDQYQKFLNKPKENKHITNSQKVRKEIKNKIKKLFQSKNLVCRILERGQVSEEGWGKHKPDNVPGRKSLYKKYDYNMLINYKDIEFDKEEIKDIYLFKTSLIGNQIKLIEPTLNIQKKKKIEGLIDYDDFKRSSSEYYFTSLDGLYRYVENLINQNY